MDERRKFERVRLPQAVEVHALDEEGKLMGRVRMLGPGGLLIETDLQFAEGSPHRITLVDESERISRPLVVVAKYRAHDCTGLEFRSLDIDAALDLGIIMGKYCAAAHAAHV